MKAEQVKALLRAHQEGDDERFWSVGLQMAADSRQGVAYELRTLIEHLRSKPRKARALLPINAASQEGIVVGHPTTKLSDMVLTVEARYKANRFLEEWNYRDVLADHGLKHKRTMLLYGPPGNGKTMLASAIAAEMELPLCLVRFDALIQSYMGTTAKKLSQIFEFISQNQGVLFIDEFDTVAGDRSRNDNDRETSGEMRRVANTLLQCLDAFRSECPVIAATNLDHLIDVAIWRRFDEVVQLPSPAPNDKKALAQRILGTNEALAGLDILGCSSYADVTRLCTETLKTQILARASQIPAGGE